MRITKEMKICPDIFLKKKELKKRLDKKKSVKNIKKESRKRNRGL